MSEHDAFDRVLAAVHAATLDETRWPATSALIDEACGLTGNGLMVAEGPTNDVRALFVGLYYRGQRRDDLEREYLTTYHALDERVPRFRQLPARRLVHITDLYTAEELKTSRTYNELLPRAGMQDSLSHETEGRRGARGGGAGRVGPPATRRRLCVLRQIGDQLVPGLEQFLLVDDVVTVEDGAALVAGQEHGDPLGDAGADQVASGGAAAIVEEAGRHPGRLTGSAPRRAPAADGDAVAVEDERAGGVAACPPSGQRLGNGL